MRVQNNRLGFAVAVSVFLHFVLIGLLLLGSFFTKMIAPSAGGGGSHSDAIDAVMVDTAQVAAEFEKAKAEKQAIMPKADALEKIKETQEVPLSKEPVELKENAVSLAQSQKLAEQKYQELLKEQQELQRQQELAKQAQLKKQEETRQKAAEAARLKAEAEAKRLEAAAKQAEEVRKAEAEAKRKAEAKAKAEAEAKRKVEQEAKAKAEAEAKRKVEQEAKAKAEAEAKRKAEQEAKAKAEAEAKRKAEQEAKAKAEAEAKRKAEQEAKAKAEAEVKRKAEQEAKAKAEAEQVRRNRTLDDFLSGGDVNSDAGRGGKVGQGQGNNVEGDAYAQRIKRLIQSKYRVDPSFTGKECEVRIILSRDGTITNYQVLKGDKTVCDAAVSAIVATRKVPPAPSDAVYQRYKSPILDFGLKVN